MSLTAILLVASIGAMIGAVGLGGFLMVPLLTLLEGTSVRQGVVVAAIAFLASGVVSLLLFRRPIDNARTERWFLLAAAPGAVAGAIAVQAAREGILTAVIVLGFAAAGLAEWLRLPRNVKPRSVNRATASGGGLVTGFTSALTGTSGPMVAMPLLSWAGMGLRERVALGQIAQIPIALGATIAFASFGDVPWRLAAESSAALCVGLVLGARATSRIDSGVLRRVAALLMWGAAAAMLMRMLA
ncbi:MAG: sulfite exporter TauE/SafE family protein [Burkholderiaceae bacterium]